MAVLWPVAVTAPENDTQTASCSGKLDHTNSHSLCPRAQNGAHGGTNQRRAAAGTPRRDLQTRALLHVDSSLIKFLLRSGTADVQLQTLGLIHKQKPEL